MRCEGCAGYDMDGPAPVFLAGPFKSFLLSEKSEKRESISCLPSINPPGEFNEKKINMLDDMGKTQQIHEVDGLLCIIVPCKDAHTHNIKSVDYSTFTTVICQIFTQQMCFVNFLSWTVRQYIHSSMGFGVVCVCETGFVFDDLVNDDWLCDVFLCVVITDVLLWRSQITKILFLMKIESSDGKKKTVFVIKKSISKFIFLHFWSLSPRSFRPSRESPDVLSLYLLSSYLLVSLGIDGECLSQGRGRPSIAKSVDGDLPPHRHDISMAGSFLHLFNLQYEDEGSYECEADNPKGKDKHRTRLFVEGAPEWVEKISSSERDIGGDYIMSCVVNGKPKPHVHFLKNGQKLVKNHELRFTDLTFADSGMYQCIAENRHGTIYANAELKVFAGAPSFERNPVKPKILAAKNGRVVIDCKPRAAPRPAISWSKGTELLYNSSRIFIWQDGSLEIVNITTSDKGGYTCFAENDRGRGNSTGSLSVTDATKFTLAPSDADVSVGESAKMECGASHDPTLDLAFIWSVSGHVIDFDQEREHYRHKMDGHAGTSSSELLISNTQLRHAGRYTCTAQTPVDDITATAELVVRGPPGPPGGVRVDEVTNSSVRVTWSHGTDNRSPISKYIIQHRDIKAGPDWREASTSPVNVEGNAEKAAVINLTPWTDYEFRVIAINTLGTGPPSDPSPKTTTMEARPVVAPSDIGGGGGTSRELTITWTPVQSQYHYGSNFGYIIAFKPHDKRDWLKVTVSDPHAHKYVHKDTDIPPSTKFEVKMKAFNSQGEGPFSLSSFIYSAQDAPSEAPTIVETRSLSATEAIVCWMPVNSQTVEGYQVRFWRQTVENEASAQRVLVPSQENHTRLDHMKPNSRYYIEVRAYNGAGYGPASVRHEVHTKKAPPSRPPKIVGNKMHSNGKKFNIAWEKVEPMANESTVEGYKVLYRAEGQTNVSLYTTGKLSIDLPIMKGQYLVEVRAHSAGGDGAVASLRVSGGGVLVAQSLSIISLMLTALFSSLL
ncbi:Contactin-1a F3/F11/contactin [Triplophysa tibetana]|uniref:Contactin-1a F3/F11/contactin n=1 Tax=Triplophysa tibetana TaxID=1572043 RepID=A0A5A9PSB2_9TELE|nr:Contactin-1a F3/F11/contactin [Triplophysa tibetana]